MHPSHHPRPDFSRNDLFYRSPPIHGHQGWLLGSQGAGATVWNPEDSVRVQFGHTDLIDRGNPASPDGERPKVTPCLRHAGQLSLSIAGRSLFDPIDLSDYAGRLGLADGELRVEGRSAAGAFSYGAIYGSDPAVFRLTYRDDLAEPAARELQLERLHSRVISNPWRWIHDESAGNAEDAAEATKAELRDGVWLVTYDDAGFQSALALQLEEVDIGHDAADEQAASERAGSRSGREQSGPAPEVGRFGIRMRLPASRSASVTVRVAVGVARGGHSASEVALTALERAAAADTEAWLNRIRRQRAASYASSRIDLPEDRYWEQLWYLGRYHLRASAQGRYPAFFINGPWGWNRDLRAWSMCWYHWNMHGSHLSIPELGEWDLFKPYADWKQRQVEPYREITRREFGTAGVSLQDQELPDGGSWEETARPQHKFFLLIGLQTALHLYRHWRYTHDERFRGEYLWPFFVDVLRFWRDYLEEDANGTLHVPRSIPYEYHSHEVYRDCLTDLSHLRAGLDAFSYLARVSPDGDADLVSWAADARLRLAMPPVVPLPYQHYTQPDDEGVRYYDNPFFHGEAYSDGDGLRAIGWSEEAEEWVSHAETYFRGLGKYGVFCSSESAPVFPAGLITSDWGPSWAEKTAAGADERREWDLYRNALRTIRRYPIDESAPDKSDVAEPKIAWTGHSLELPAFARLGLTDQFRKAVSFYIDRYQMFPQGMFNYHPRQRWFGNHSLPSSVTGEELRIEHDPYAIHFAFEPQGIFGEALTLALLDCAGGIIRLFQAYDRDARITLPAWDGFTVTAEQRDGTLLPIRIHSRLGGECRIRVPWERVAVSSVAAAETSGTSVDAWLEHAVVTFATEPEGEYVVSAAAAATTAEGAAADVEPSPKTYRRHAVLGLPRRM